MHTLDKTLRYITILPAIAAAGPEGARIKNIESQTGMFYLYVSDWLCINKKPGGKVKEIKHRYFLTERGKAIVKAIPTPKTALAPIILPVIAKAGGKGASTKEIEAATGIPRDICSEWLRVNRSGSQDTEKLSNGRHVLSAKGFADYRKQNNIVQTTDIIDI